MMTKWVFSLVAVGMVLTSPGLGQGRFSRAGSVSAFRYLRDTQRLVVEADKALESGAADQARSLYQQAIGRFDHLIETYPDADIDHAHVAFRRQYCENMLAQVQWHEASAEPQDVPPDSRSQGDTLPGGSADRSPLGTVGDPVTASSGDETDAASKSQADWMELSRRITDLQRSGRHAQALQHMQQALGRWPHSTRIRLLLATLFVEQAEYGDALLVLEDLPDADREAEPALILRAAALYGEGAFFDALLALDRALQRNPHSAQAYLNLAWLRFRMEPQANATEVEAFYRFAVRLGAHRDLKLESLLGLEAN